VDLKDTPAQAENRPKLRTWLALNEVGGTRVAARRVAGELLERAARRA
jgi:hypothetical protein